MTNINKFNNDMNMANNIGSSRIKKSHNNHETNDRAIQKADSMKELMVNHKNNISAKLVFQSISAHFSFASSSTNSSQKNMYHDLANVDLHKAEKESDTNSIFDFELVAENVMSFISQSIMAAKENGANNEKLTSMFEQAHKGVDIGVGDALKELNEMTILDDELSKGITKSQELIHQGIDKLADKTLNVIENDQIGIETSTHQSFSTSDLSIVTADGDNVIIKFDHYLANEQRNYSGKNTDVEQQFLYKEINFRFEVQGELDKQERESIELLVSDVVKLQQDFFSGDMMSALEQAQQLNFNTDEISSLNLQLSMIKSNAASQKYTDVANIVDKEKVEDKQLLAKKMKPVIDFIEQFKKVEARAENVLSNDLQQINRFYEGILKAGLMSHSEEVTNTMTNKWNDLVKKLMANKEQ